MEETWGNSESACILISFQKFFQNLSCQTRGAAYTPVLTVFEAELTLYPDRAKATFVLQGINEGFRLGCDKPVTLKLARRNKFSGFWISRHSVK